MLTKLVLLRSYLLYFNVYICTLSSFYDVGDTKYFQEPIYWLPTLSLHSDPDSVVLCVLATDEEDEGDIALQIHFTLLQAFCCDNDIDILRVSGARRLAKVLREDREDSNGNEPRDLHCILVTVRTSDYSSE